MSKTENYWLYFQEKERKERSRKALEYYYKNRDYVLKRQAIKKHQNKEYYKQWYEENKSKVQNKRKNKKEKKEIKKPIEIKKPVNFTLFLN